MSTHIAETSDRTILRSSDDRGLIQQEDSGTSRAGWLVTLRLWIERSQQRRALRELARLDGSRLEDLGVSREEALRECAKRFWKR